MSLVAEPEITEKKLEANRANAQLSSGAITVEGRERNRDCHLRHGLYAQSEVGALRALGEDPNDYEDLRKKLFAKWGPSDAFEEELVRSLARALWRMRRAHRMQEGLTVRHLQAMDEGRKSSAVIMGERLQRLLANVKELMYRTIRTDFATQDDDLKIFKELFPSELADGRVGPLSLLFQLVRSRQGGETPRAGETTPFAGIRPAEGRERKELRQKLFDHLKRQAGRLEELLKDCVDPKEASPVERAGDLAAMQEPSALAFKMEDASFRQIWRLTNLLMKIKEQNGEKPLSTMILQEDGQQSTRGSLIVRRGTQVARGSRAGRTSGKRASRKKTNGTSHDVP